jgi:hypothetical protein
MRILLLVTLASLATCLGCALEAPSPGASLPRGLPTGGKAHLDALLQAQGDPEAFARELDVTASSGQYESVIILTHAMFELPWDGVTRSIRLVPKLATERRLDSLVAGKGHDRLSGAYFRALKRRGDVEKAKDALLTWTIEHESKLVWDPKMSRFDEPK